MHNYYPKWDAKTIMTFREGVDRVSWCINSISCVPSQCFKKKIKLLHRPFKSLIIQPSVILSVGKVQRNLASLLEDTEIQDSRLANSMVAFEIKVQP